MQRVITYLFDTDDEQSVPGVRVTVGSVKVKEMGRYSAMLREARETMSERLGFDLRSATSEQLAQIGPDQNVVYESFQRWSRCVAGIKKIEVAGAEPDTWTESTLEALGWLAVVTGELLPLNLTIVLDQSVQECNAGLFGFVNAPEQKKSGLISVI